MSFLFINASTFAQPVAVMSYNIRYDNPADSGNAWQHRKLGFLQLLTYYEPDLLGIQEGLAHQVYFIDTAWTDYDFVGVGRDDGNQKGEFSAIFYKKSRFKVIEKGTFWLSESPEKVSKGWDAALPRICTYALLEDKVGRRKFWVLNTHFDHKGERAREAAAALILAKIDALNPKKLPVVLMGDLNTEPSTPPIITLKKGLRDALEISAKPLYGPIGTFNGFAKDAQPQNRIDYVFVSAAFRVLSYAHLDDRLLSNAHISDHFAVFVKLDLQ